MSKTRKRSASSKRTRSPVTSTRGTRRTSTGRSVQRDHESHIDGCDIDFKETLATPDAELPAARGGVEGPPRRVRRTPNQRKGRSSRQ
jgi:hypothetical protein